jgi:phosphoserine phosphatase
MKLLVFDVEGTLFETKIRLPGALIDSTIWQTIASVLGPSAVREEVATHERWNARRYKSYIEWMKDTITIHRRYGLTKEMFHSIIDAAEYNAGVTETFRAIDRNRFEPVLISGGFRELAAKAQRDLRVQHAFAACEYLFGPGDTGTLDWYNLLPCDFEGKMDFILLMLREYGLTMTDWIFVGDGKNDVPIAARAPLSVGYRPHPALRDVVTHRIERFEDLLPILALDQGARSKAAV